MVSVEVSGFTGNVTFLNLTQNGIYYVAETDEYGVVIPSTSSLTVKYTNSGKVQMSEAVRSVVAQTVYTSLPGGYRYTGTLTLTVNVTSSSGSAKAVTNTFYVGIYRNADYSDTPTIVSMTLSGVSSDIFGDSSAYYSVDDNGLTTGYAAAVQTGDATPILGCMVLMCAAVMAFGLGWKRRRQKL